MSEQDPPQDPTTRWKVLTAVSAILAVALGIGVAALLGNTNNAEAQGSADAATIVDLQASLDEATSQIDESTQTIEALSAENDDLQNQITELTDAAEQVTAAAQKAIGSAVEALTVPTDLQNPTEQEVTDAVTRLTAATKALAAKPNDLATQRAHAIALAATAQICAGGTTGALTSLSTSDVDAATATLELVAPACEAAFAADNQPS